MITFELVEMMVREGYDPSALDAQEKKDAIEWLESRPLVMPRENYGAPLGTNRPMFELYDDHASAEGTSLALDEGKVIARLDDLSEKEGAWVESERRMIMESYFKCLVCRLAAVEGHDFIVIEPEMEKT